MEPAFASNRLLQMVDFTLGWKRFCEIRRLKHNYQLKGRQQQHKCQ